MLESKLYLKRKSDIKCASVGVICFSVDPKTQNIYFLLGKETCFNKLDSNKGVWCDFGGKPLYNETFEETAGREFMEESLNTIKLTNNDSENNSITQMLKQKKYYERIDVVLKNYDKNKNKRKNILRVYFLKQIPWQPMTIQNFLNTRKKLVELKNNYGSKISKNYQFFHPAIEVYENNYFRVKNEYLEKHSLNYWSLDRLNEVVRKNGTFKNQKFRKSFMPILKIITRKFYCQYRN